MMHNGGGMKRLGLRSSLLSIEEKVDVETKISQTSEPQLFYDHVLAVVFISESVTNSMYYNNSELSDSLILLISFIHSLDLSLLYKWIFLKKAIG